jgi:hypothetical protein
MGNRRMGLKRMEALLEAVDRDLDLTNSTLTAPTITNAISVSVASSATAGFKQGAMFVPCVPSAAPEAKSGAGAVNVTSFYTSLSSGGPEANAIAAGTELGQLKKVQMIVDGGDSTFTITNPVDASNDVITFADVGDYCLLMWVGTAWRVLELGNDADGVSAPGIA